MSPLYDAQHRRIAQTTGDIAGDAILYRGVGGLGEGWAAGLSSARKGQLGEDLSALKTASKGDWPKGAHEPFDVSGGKTFVDHSTVRGKMVGSKFGPSARLSPRQREAQQEYGATYRVDRWGPKDIGRIAGGAAAANWPFTDGDDRQ